MRPERCHPEAAAVAGAVPFEELTTALWPSRSASALEQASQPNIVALAKSQQLCLYAANSQTFGSKGHALDCARHLLPEPSQLWHDVGPHSSAGDRDRAQDAGGWEHWPIDAPAIWRKWTGNYSLVIPIWLIFWEDKRLIEICSIV